MWINYLDAKSTRTVWIYFSATIYPRFVHAVLYVRYNYEISKKSTKKYDRKYTRFLTIVLYKIVQQK